MTSAGPYLPAFPDLEEKTATHWPPQRVHAAVRLCEGSISRFFELLLMDADSVHVQLLPEAASVQLGRRLQAMDSLDLMK